MTTEPQLNPEQQELLAQLAKTWAAAPAMRFGQLLAYSMGTRSLERSVEMIPIVQDSDIQRGLASLERTFTANKLPTPPSEPGA